MLSYKAIQKIHSIVMIFALIWMTVSLPFVASAQIAHDRDQLFGASLLNTDMDQDIADDDQGICNPYGNNTEEKGPSNVTQASEEYLHHSDGSAYFIDLYLSHHTLHSAGEYTAFHGELLCPPPNQLS